MNDFAEALAAAVQGFVWVYPAVVMRVIDGDTFECRVRLSATIELYGENVRVQGINAPELGTPEGADAKRYAEALVGIGTSVTLFHERKDKYGRFLAKVQLPSGEDFGTLMLKAGQAVVYAA